MLIVGINVRAKSGHQLAALVRGRNCAPFYVVPFSVS
jgi:hypothetical protein